MKIALLGATGRTGRQFLAQAGAAGHDVTAVVRDPAALTGRPHLSVIAADVMDPDAIGPLLADHDAVVTTIGPRQTRIPSTVQTESTASILSAMRHHGTRRLIVVSNSGMVTTGDGPVSRIVAKPILRRLLRHTWADMRRMEDVVRASDLDWTILRPPMLTDGKRTGAYRTALDRNVRGGIRVSRADVADAILRCLADPALVHATVSIAN
ncbi:MAG TPA: SDR family oxidoreductase [Pseudonocardiaceae bacterium]|nr:SDR family oxidoreductase [Pseudonocardiaceae bacterium]